MSDKKYLNSLSVFLFAVLGFGLWIQDVNASPRSAAASLSQITQRNAEIQVRHLVEPLLEKYCKDECKLMSVSVQLENHVPEEVAPGFEDPATLALAEQEIIPSSARLKLLINDRVGPISRTKLMELVQQFLDTLDFPVTIDTQIAHFPPAMGGESKVAEMREKIQKNFRSTLEDLFSQFCPDQCLTADFNLATSTVNAEEAQYGAPGEFVQDGDTALKIKDLSATLLIDEMLSPEEQANVLTMAKLKTNAFKNVTLNLKSLKFPHPTQWLAQRGLAPNGQLLADGKDAHEKNTNRSLASTASNSSTSTQDSKNSESKSSNSESKNLSNVKESQTSTTEAKNNETNQRQEHFERFEKIERVESGDAVQAELQKFKVYGLILSCSILSLLIFVAMATLRPRKNGEESSSPITRIIQSMSGDPTMGTAASSMTAGASEDRRKTVAVRYEIERIFEELISVFAQNPKVAKHVFSRVLTEEGVEVTAQYLQIFGESVVMDMLRDPSLQSDMSELMEYYAKNPQELKDDEKLELLKRLHNRTVAGKLMVMGNRSSNLFDFLAEMDGTQIMELVRNESMTVKSIVLTQVDPQKRGTIYGQLDEASRMTLLTELSRIDYLPRDYIFNVANALKRKRRDNPRLNTEALPGSEVLITLLERTGPGIQRAVLKNLEISNPESSRTVKSKLVSLDTLRFLRDGQLLEVVLSLRHDELLQFLQGSPLEIKNAIFSKSPKELIIELEEELVALQPVSREVYLGVERKVLNRMKMMAIEGLINLVETNERMFNDGSGDAIGGALSAAQGLAQANGADEKTSTTTANIRKVSGW